MSAAVENGVEGRKPRGVFSRAFAKRAQPFEEGECCREMEARHVGDYTGLSLVIGRCCCFIRRDLTWQEDTAEETGWQPLDKFASTAFYEENRAWKIYSSVSDGKTKFGATRATSAEISRDAFSSIAPRSRRCKLLR